MLYAFPGRYIDSRCRIYDEALSRLVGGEPVQIRVIYVAHVISWVGCVLPGIDMCADPARSLSAAGREVCDLLQIDRS